MMREIVGVFTEGYGITWVCFWKPYECFLNSVAISVFEKPQWSIFGD